MINRSLSLANPKTDHQNDSEKTFTGSGLSDCHQCWKVNNFSKIGKLII